MKESRKGKSGQAEKKDPLGLESRLRKGVDKIASMLPEDGTELGDGGRAAILLAVEGLIRGEQAEVVKLEKKRKWQVSAMMWTAATFFGLSTFLYFRFDQVEAIAAAKVYQMIGIDKPRVGHKTAIVAHEMCLKQITDWIRELREAKGISEEERSIMIDNMAAIGEVLQTGLETNRQALAKVLSQKKYDKIDPRTRLEDPMTGQIYSLTTPGGDIDEDLLKKMLMDKTLLAGLMAKAKAYSLASRGELGEGGAVSIRPAIAEATGARFRLKPKGDDEPDKTKGNTGKGGK